MTTVTKPEKKKSFWTTEEIDNLKIKDREIKSDFNSDDF